MANCYATLTETHQLGDICRARDLGLKGGKGGCSIYIWAECPRCKERRWVIKSHLKRYKTGFCRKCFLATWKPRHKGIRGELSNLWKGGRVNHGEGYIWIRLQPDNFFYSMIGKTGYVLEHRLIMAQHLGRCLHRWEIVHHKNHIKDDNRIENLQLVSDDRHKQISILEQRIVYLEDRVLQLEAEIILLKQTPERIYL